MDENLAAALQVAHVLDDLGLRWFLGGSLASSIYGVPRATLDADLIADPRPAHVRPLLAALGDDWYADENAIREAIVVRSSFNLISLSTAMKVDIFIAKARPFEGGEFSRVQRKMIDQDGSFSIPVACAEDTVVANLEWFRIGGEMSDRQWQDILGVRRFQVTSSTSRS